jgi:hypothetical protein
MDNKELNPDQIQQMIRLLQSMLPATDSTTITSQEPEKKETTHDIKPKKQTKSKSNTSTNKGGASKFTTHHNKFIDMPEMHMHKEDIAIDQKLITHPPVPRARTFKFVNATCRVCGKKENVNPMLITDSLDRYKCNKCSGAAG